MIGNISKKFLEHSVSIGYNSKDCRPFMGGNGQEKPARTSHIKPYTDFHNFSWMVNHDHPPPLALRQRGGPARRCSLQAGWFQHCVAHNWACPIPEPMPDHRPMPKACMPIWLAGCATSLHQRPILLHYTSNHGSCPLYRLGLSIPLLCKSLVSLCLYACAGKALLFPSPASPLLICTARTGHLTRL